MKFANILNHILNLSAVTMLFSGSWAIAAASVALNNNYQEVIQPNEEHLIENIAALVSKNLDDQKNAKTTVVTRDAHAKHHGCVKANVTVLGNIPQELKVGVFKDAKSYPAWIRYSNGSGKSDNDQVGDARGMAIKIMGVKKETQDFLMINNNVFFIESIADYLEFFTVLQKDGNPRKFFIPGFNPANWRLKEAKIAKQITSNKMSNPLKSRYWSTTSYLLGQNVIKFGVKPCSGSANSLETADDQQTTPNYLRENMATTLKQSNACFDFMVQVGRDPAKQPLENPMVEWNESDAPFVKVAQIDIVKQEFNSEKQLNFCENLSFTPWHSLPEHRPLGAINRARKTVYQTISSKRHQLNGVEEIEPTPESK
jgi:hypothetical protein